MNRPRITLRQDEMLLTKIAGEWRLQDALTRRRDAGLGPSKYDNTPAWHISGCRGELATAIYLNLSWRPNVGLVGEVDVGGMVNVRSTRRDNGSLIIKPKDVSKYGAIPYVLALQQTDEATFELAGWMRPVDAAAAYVIKEGYGDPAYFVPQDKLQSVEQLFTSTKT